MLVEQIYIGCLAQAEVNFLSQIYDSHHYFSFEAPVILQ